MRTVSRTRWSLLVLSLLVVAAPVLAQTSQDVKQQPFQPQVGQGGKDVVWVPTPQALVEKMLDMAQVTPQDFVMDLGSGDGRTVITAAKRGARALGIEYNADMVELSKQNAAKAGVGDRAQFVKADLFEIDLSKASVITLFLLPDINLKLRPKILDLKPGTRVVSNTFTMEDWTPDETATIDGDCTSWCTALFWIVPAKAAGVWTWSGAELTLAQTFQMLSGTLKNGGGTVEVTGGRLRGDQISFVAGPTTYTGKLSGTTVEGTATTGSSSVKWTATRAAR
jgi:SAM-dependent methyltransferase